MEFLIQSKSSGSEYLIRVFDGPVGPIITCSCPAGESGQYCKHRLALIDGNTTEVLEASHDVQNLQDLIKDTPLQGAIDDMRTIEAAMAEAKIALKQIKKNVAALMYGHTH